MQKWIVDSTKIAAQGKEIHPWIKPGPHVETKYLLTFPLENNLANLPGAFDKGQPAYSNIYKGIALPLINERVLQQNNTGIGTTEHAMGANEKLVTLINYTTEDITIEPIVKKGFVIDKGIYGSFSGGSSLTVKANDALVLSVIKK